MSGLCRTTTDDVEPFPLEATPQPTKLCCSALFDVFANWTHREAALSDPSSCLADALCSPKALLARCNCGAVPDAGNSFFDYCPVPGQLCIGGSIRPTFMCGFARCPTLALSAQSNMTVATTNNGTWPSHAN